MEPTEHNRRAWEERQRRRSAAEPAAPALPAAVAERLPDLEGRHVLHLACGTGAASHELARLGALVTAVDSDAEALAVLADGAPDGVAAVHASPQQLPLELRRGRFDIVYTGAGATAELQDLAAWASGIAGALRPGGGFVLYEHHPVALCIDPLGRWREDYFEGEIANMTRERVELTPTPTHFFPLGEVVTRIVAAGLAIRSLDELRGERRWGPPSADDRIPANYLLLAERRI
jgi:SAM-dependent methyltransferase